MIIDKTIFDYPQTLIISEYFCPGRDYKCYLQDRDEMIIGRINTPYNFFNLDKNGFYLFLSPLEMSADEATFSVSRYMNKEAKYILEVHEIIYNSKARQIINAILNIGSLILLGTFCYFILLKLYHIFR